MIVCWNAIPFTFNWKCVLSLFFLSFCLLDSLSIVIEFPKTIKVCRETRNIGILHVQQPFDGYNKMKPLHYKKNIENWIILNEK